MLSRWSSGSGTNLRRGRPRGHPTSLWLWSWSSPVPPNHHDGRPGRLEACAQGIAANDLSATASRPPIELTSVGDAEVRPWFAPGFGEALSHRIAKHIGRARSRVRIPSPVLTSGPILGTLAEVVNEGRCNVSGVVDETQVDEVFH